MDDRFCEECGAGYNLHRHHIFGAANRKHSDRLGLVADLCVRCHYLIHHDRDMMIRYRQRYQAAFECKSSREEFMQIFGRNYL